MAQDKQLAHADKVLTQVKSALLNYDLITPLNAVKEWAVFQQNNYSYNPQFTYSSFNVKPYLDTLNKLDIAQDTTLGLFLETTRQKLLTYATLLQQRGTDHFSTQAYHGVISKELLKNAKDILTSKKPKVTPAHKDKTSQDLYDRIRKELQQYGIQGWNIVFNQQRSSPVSIQAASKTLTIRSHSTFTQRRIEKLLVHEIGTHVLRAENGSRQIYSLFATGVPGYEATEEGLAGYNERTQGFASKQTLIRYALRVLATHEASQGSFMDVYHAIYPYLQDEEKTFFFALRAKRGMGDTSKPGGFLKDHIYLQGRRLIEQFVEKGGDIRQLYAGKIRVEDVYLVDQGILNPAHLLPLFLR